MIYLQDFPRTLEDAQELIALGFDKLNCLNIVEEIFNREIEDETDDVETPKEPIKSAESLQKSDGEEGEEKPKVPEKLFNKMVERVAVFENGIKINRLLKTQAVGSNCRECIV
jgi:hypothetical protein